LRHPLQNRHIIRNVLDDQRILQRSIRKRYEIHEFQPLVKEVLQKLLPDYDVIEYTQKISWTEASSVKHEPDLAIISKNRRHWTIVEVELHTHEVGYSHSSEFSSPHIYQQVETFAYGDYHTAHIEKIAEILDEDVANLDQLLSTVPEVMVIGDNSDTIYGPEKTNWSRMLEIGDNVHLAFLEIFEDQNNHSETCTFFSGWLPPADITQSQRLKKSGGNWIDCLTTFKNQGPIICSNGYITIEIEGINTQWKHNKGWNILQSLDSKSSSYLQQFDDGSIYELQHSERGYTLKVIR
jgi:hypothetical protein